MLKVGQRIAPGSAGVLQDGSPIDLGQPTGKPLILFFFPKAFTPGCTREACGFRDAHEELVGRHGARVLGISRDDPATLLRFQQEYRLSFDLVSDRDGSLTAAFDARRLGGIVSWPKRVTYLIDGDAVVRGAFRHELSMQAHIVDAKQALDALPR